MEHAYLKPETIVRIQADLARAGVSEADLEETFVRGSGSGGQKINKTSSCVCLRHAPTGTVVKCQRTRAREVNRWVARKELAERILSRIEGVRTARQQEDEKVRRQKRRRSRRQKARMLADKAAHAVKKARRRPVSGREE